MDFLHFRFPTVDEHREFFYPTAYVDHGGRDWNCGRITYDGHGGSDFGFGSWEGMDAGKQIVAAANGIVVDTHDGEYDRCTGESADCSGYGNYVILRHADGRYTFYGHLMEGTVEPSVGDFLACGDPVGFGGSSGHSTGPHLHFEVREPDWTVVEPFAGECGADETSWVEQGEYDSVPGTTCAEVAACEPVTTLSCGETWSGRNDDEGSTKQIAWYGCTEGTEEGPEMVFSFATDRTEPVVVTLTGLAVDLDLFLMPSADCDGQSCLAASKENDTNDERMEFAAVAGELYTLMVDGYAGGAGPFTLSIACEGALPEGLDDDGPTDSGEDSATDPGGRPPRAQVVPGDEQGCGCQGVPAGAWAAGGAVLVVARRRPR